MLTHHPLHTRRRKKLLDDTNKKKGGRGYLSRRGARGHGSAVVRVVHNLGTPQRQGHRGVLDLERRREMAA
jgi:hypothetical protein